MFELTKNKEYKKLLDKIGSSFQQAKQRAYKAIDDELTKSNWNTGRYIFEFEQKGNIKAEYGKELLLQLSKDLTKVNGKGFSRSNLVYIRLFYIKYPNGVTPSHLLSWSHYYELLKINDDIEREFYKNQNIISDLRDSLKIIHNSLLCVSLRNSTNHFFHHPICFLKKKLVSLHKDYLNERKI